MSNRVLPRPDDAQLARHRLQLACLVHAL